MSTVMHAYLIIGKTKEERVKKAKELLSDLNIKQVHALPPEKDTYNIETVRNLRRDLILSPLDRDRGRGVIITEADRLTHEAANAFLKILEEPLGKTIIILTAPNRESVLETVSSRCEVRDLGNFSFEINGEEKEEAEMVFGKLSEAEVGERLEMVDQLALRERAIEFVQKQIYFARHLMIEKVERGEEVKDIARIIELLEQAGRDLEQNVNVKLAIGELLIRWGDE